ncbi:MAG: hypothetical protein RIR51_1480 [Bacteroidota bacterium]|jgi:pantoate--beta-alanine ligase
MKVFRYASEFENIQNQLKKDGKTLGFVPTMGALHAGHISLINQVKLNADKCIASIFVNPTQFNDLKDFEKYPKTIESDIQKLEAANCDFLYLPEVNDIYPNGIPNSFPPYNIGQLETIYEGEHRPGHFQGVCLVVDILLKKINPHFLFLGEKDFQQVAVIKKMVSEPNYLPKVEIFIGNTIREASGLAMSSRNTRLSKVGLTIATEIFQGFNSIQLEIKKGNRNIQELKNNFEQNLIDKGFNKIDYIAFSKLDTLEEIKEINSSFRILFAGFLEGIRLIDNIKIELT